MQRAIGKTARRAGVGLTLAAITALGTTGAVAAEIEVWHADSLAGPMRALKAAYELKNPGVTVNLTSGVSKPLAERILKGEVCDVFVPSSPAVVDDDLMGKPIGGAGRLAATWYVVVSANEMAIITAKGNPLGIAKVGDLVKPGVRFARVTGEKDLATGRTIEFIKRAAALEGTPELAQRIIDSAPANAEKPISVPITVNAVRQGNADAGVVYYSAAVAAKADVDIVRFPASVNMSEAIRNAALVPGTAKNVVDGIGFVAYLITPEAQTIFASTGQPPVVPAIRRGTVPAEIR
ncbi:MAG: substrate-binding domain-containing protein [Betaproteobacteria bacterium]